MLTRSGISFLGHWALANLSPQQAGLDVLLCDQLHLQGALYTQQCAVATATLRSVPHEAQLYFPSPQAAQAQISQSITCAVPLP